MKNEDPKERERNIAHCWQDKRVLRFFRHNFDRRDYKNLRDVYIALTEIQSDFTENGVIHNFSKTVATYAGMDREVATLYLRSLQRGGLVDFDDGNLKLWIFPELSRARREEWINSIQDTIDHRRKFPPQAEKSTGGNFRLYKNEEESSSSRKDNKKPPSEVRLRRTRDPSDDLESKWKEFRQEYPDRHPLTQGWGRAKRGFLYWVQKCHEDPDDIISSAKILFRLKRDSEPRFIPMASTFLGREGKWKEQLEAASSSNGRKRVPLRGADREGPSYGKGTEFNTNEED